MSRVCVFDVNETLLDLQALDPHFERVFGDAALRKAWFSQLLQSALVATVTNAYTNFGTIGIAALEMIAARQGRDPFLFVGVSLLCGLGPGRGS